MLTLAQIIANGEMTDGLMEAFAVSSVGLTSCLFPP